MIKVGDALPAVKLMEYVEVEGNGCSHIALYHTSMHVRATIQCSSLNRSLALQPGQRVEEGSRSGGTFP